MCSQRRAMVSRVVSARASVARRSARNTPGTFITSRPNVAMAESAFILLRANASGFVRSTNASSIETAVESTPAAESRARNACHSSVSRTSFAS